MEPKWPLSGTFWKNGSTFKKWSYFYLRAPTRVFYASLEEKRKKLKINILTLVGGAYSGHYKNPALFYQIICWKCLMKVLRKGELVKVVEGMNLTKNVLWLWYLSLCPLDTLQSIYAWYTPCSKRKYTLCSPVITQNVARAGTPAFFRESQSEFPNNQATVCEEIPMVPKL